MIKYEHSKLQAHVSQIVNNLAFIVGDLAQMYEHKNIDPDDMDAELSDAKRQAIERIVRLVNELLEEK